MYKFILGIVCGILAVIFVAQNTEMVYVSLLFWTVTVSRAIMYVVLFILGLLSGFVVTGVRRVAKRKK
jgi:uncharacterized integral membrane protein